MSSDKQFRLQGEYLRSCREAKGLSQAEAAEALGIKHQFVSNIERGTASIPKKRIADVERVLGADHKLLISAILEDGRRRIVKNLERSK